MNKIEELHLIINNLERTLRESDLPTHYSNDIYRSLKHYREELNTWIELREEKLTSFSEGAYNAREEKDGNGEWEFYTT